MKNNPKNTRNLEIIEGILYLGSICSAKNLKFLEENKIKGILNIAQWENDTIKDKGIKEMKIDISDNIQGIHSLNISIFNEVFKFVEQNKPVLFHCFAGRSRSPSFAIAFVMKYMKLDLYKSTDFVEQKRPQISLHTSFCDLLYDYETKLIEEKIICYDNKERFPLEFYTTYFTNKNIKSESVKHDIFKKVDRIRKWVDEFPEEKQVEKFVKFYKMMVEKEKKKKLEKNNKLKKKTFATNKTCFKDGEGKIKKDGETEANTNKEKTVKRKKKEEGGFLSGFNKGFLNQNRVKRTKNAKKKKKNMKGKRKTKKRKQY